MQNNTCPYCSHVNPSKAKFCQECGRRVKRSTDPLIGKQIGNQRLVKRIGVGGMGVVYLAEHVNLGKKYAVKFLHPQFASDEEVVERFRREAKVIASLEHENIIRETDFGWFDGVGFYLIMEYLEGHTLKEMIREEGAMRLQRVRSIFEQLLDALSEAHSKHVVHRDLKPENLFLLTRRKKEVLKILDFGIARIAFMKEGQAEFTMDGEVYGSPTYMAPEQARGEISQVDHRSDLYAAGVILVETLTGRPPFRGSNPSDVMLKHISTPPPPLAELRPDLSFSPALEAVVQKALSKNKEDRFNSAVELWEELDRALSSSVTRGVAFQNLQEAEPPASYSTQPAPESADEGATKVLDPYKEVSQPGASYQENSQAGNPSSQRQEWPPQITSESASFPRADAPSFHPLGQQQPVASTDLPTTHTPQPADLPPVVPSMEHSQLPGTPARNNAPWSQGPTSTQPGYGSEQQGYGHAQQGYNNAQQGYDSSQQGYGGVYDYDDDDDDDATEMHYGVVPSKDYVPSESPYPSTSDSPALPPMPMAMPQPLPPLDLPPMPTQQGVTSTPSIPAHTSMQSNDLAVALQQVDAGYPSTQTQDSMSGFGDFDDEDSFETKSPSNAKKLIIGGVVLGVLIMALILALLPRENALIKPNSEDMAPLTPPGYKRICASNGKCQFVKLIKKPVVRKKRPLPTKAPDGTKPPPFRGSSNTSTEVISLTLITRPPGATARFEGRVCKSTPCTFRFLKGSKVNITISKDGYLNRLLPWRASQDQKIDIRLIRAP